jgi:hypothetical protein
MLDDFELFELFFEMVECSISLSFDKLPLQEFSGVDFRIRGSTELPMELRTQAICSQFRLEIQVIPCL